MPAPKGNPLWEKQRPLERYQIQRDGDVKGPFDSEKDNSQKQKLKIQETGEKKHIAIHSNLETPSIFN